MMDESESVTRPVSARRVVHLRNLLLQLVCVRRGLPIPSSQELAGFDQWSDLKMTLRQWQDAHRSEEPTLERAAKPWWMRLLSALARVFLRRRQDQ